SAMRPSASSACACARFSTCRAMVRLLLCVLSGVAPGIRKGQNTMTLRSRYGIVVVGMMAAALTSACEKPAAVAPPPPEVYVVPVVQRDVPVYLDLVGQTEGTQDVDVRARVEGFLETMDFREGRSSAKVNSST